MTINTHKTRAHALLATTLFLGLASLQACGDDTNSTDDDGAGGESPSGGKTGSGGKTASGGKASSGGETSSGGKGNGSGGSSNLAGSSSGGGSIDLGGQGGELTQPPDPDALYALTTQVFGETENTSYILLTDSLDQDASLSLADAQVEVAGRALGTGPDEAGVMFVAGDLAPTITRYDLRDDDTLSGGSSVSFLGAGVTKFGEYGGQFQYLSADKAYWFDGPTAQIVVWDPSAMKLVDTVPLTELAADGEVLSFTAAPVRVGDKLYTFAAWRAGLVVSPRAAVVAVDTTTDSAEVILDERCGYVRDGALGADGDLYLATEAFGSAAYELNAENPEPCLLRFDLETESFDEDFEVALDSLLGDSQLGSLVVGPDNKAYLRSLAAADFPEGVDNPRVLASAPVWGWTTLTLGDSPEVELLDSAPLSSGSVLPFQLGTRRFAPTFVDGESTEFTELGPEGPVAGEALGVPGLVFSAVKLR